MIRPLNDNVEYETREVKLALELATSITLSHKNRDKLDCMAQFLNDLPQDPEFLKEFSAVLLQLVQQYLVQYNEST